MQAVILAGGPGKRLRSLTSVLPKPLIPLDGMPVVEVMLRRIAAQGVAGAVLCTGYLGGVIEAYLRDLNDLPIRLTCRRDNEPSGTAGPLRDLLDILETEFVVVNGDVLTDLDVRPLMDAHRHAGSGITIVTYPFQQTMRYGVVETRQNGAVARIKEKPVATVEISAGIYAVSRDKIGPLLMATAGRLDFPELVEMAIKAGLRVGSHLHRGEWFDIGEPDDLRAAQSAFARNPARFLGRTSFLTEGHVGKIREGVAQRDSERGSG